MSDPCDLPGLDGSVGSPSAGATFAAYSAARRRFLETLHWDSEMRRLEAAWSLPDEPAGGRFEASRPPDVTSTGL